MIPGQRNVTSLPAVIGLCNTLVGSTFTLAFDNAVYSAIRKAICTAKNKGIFANTVEMIQYPIHELLPIAEISALILIQTKRLSIDLIATESHNEYQIAGNDWVSHCKAV